MKNCQDTTELISLGFEEKLAFRQHFSIKMHLLICPYCRAFKHNTEEIHELMQQFKQRDDE